MTSPAGQPEIITYSKFCDLLDAGALESFEQHDTFSLGTFSHPQLGLLSFFQSGQAVLIYNGKFDDRRRQKERASNSAT